MYGTNYGDVAVATELYPLSAVSADGNGDPVDISTYDGEIAVIVQYDAGSQGSVDDVQQDDRTLAIKLQHCATDDGEFVDVPDGGLTGLTTEAGLQKISINSDELEAWIQIVFDIEGAASPTYNIAASVLGALKNPA